MRAPGPTGQPSPGARLARDAAGRYSTAVMEPSLAGWRRHAAVAFIVVWLAVQIALPLAQKLDLDASGSRYRYARYSWAMFSRIVPRYEVRLYRTRAGGGPEPIPDIDRWVHGYRSPEPMPMAALYTSEGEVLDRFSGLVTAIARGRG